ncbi:MAG: DNA-directed RNA polymerase subunit omega [Nitrospiria bacterium]
MDIVSLPVEIDSEIIDSRYRLVIVAAQRARQIMEGSQPTIDPAPDQKETTVAIEEVLSGKLDILYGEDAVTALREERRIREEARRRAMLAEREGDGTSQARKDLDILLGAPTKKEEILDLTLPPELSPPAEAE